LPVEWIGEVAAKPKKLIPYTGEVIPLKPTWPDRADALEKGKNWAGLLACCRQWTQAEPDNAYAWFSLAIAYGKLGRHREAIAAYQEALRLKPDHIKAWGTLAIAFAASGNRSAAPEAVKELRRYDPQKADELFNLIMKP
jgi:cytochrome c-type biogenesis protein CcmH/NrfG